MDSLEFLNWNLFLNSLVMLIIWWKLSNFQILNFLTFLIQTVILTIVSHFQIMKSQQFPFLNFLSDYQLSHLVFRISSSSNFLQFLFFPLYTLYLGVEDTTRTLMAPRIKLEVLKYHPTTDPFFLFPLAKSSLDSHRVLMSSIVVVDDNDYIFYDLNDGGLGYSGGTVRDQPGKTEIVWRSSETIICF